LGTGIETNLNQLKDMLFEAMGKTVPVEFIDQDEHLVRRRQSSTQKIRDMLGFDPRVPLKEGIRRYVEAMTQGR